MGTGYSYYLTDKQLADRWNVSRDTVWRWNRADLIPAPLKLGPNCTRWVLEDIQAHEAQKKTQAACSTEPTKAQADRCTTHHHACDCREYAHQQRIAELERQNTEHLRAYEMTAKANVRLREALQSIAANTCCEPCQEAKLVAQAALEEF